MVKPNGIFLLANLALAFYHVGTIWEHELDIFRTWTLLGPDTFHRVQKAHWRKLPYWVLIPFALSLAGSVALVWYHPPGSPAWGIWGGLGCLVVTNLGTALAWGRWQAALSRDPLGADSPYLTIFLRTHWIRTLLVNAYAFILLAWTIVIL